MAFLIIIYVLAIVIAIAGAWMAFEKAGTPGWGAIIPIYNLYIGTKMAGKPAWWVILAFIPIVGIVVGIIVSMQIAKNFGKSEAFGIGMVFLPFIFWSILGFGDARWQAAPVENPASI